MPRDWATGGRTASRALGPRDKPPARDSANTCNIGLVHLNAAQRSVSGSQTQAGMPRKRRRPTKKQRPKQKQSNGTADDWCEIKGILDQRVVDGQLQYLVDWEDHPVTGEVYPHEWKIKTDLSEESIAQWEGDQRRQQTDQQQPSDQTSNTDESQEPRPANIRRRSSLPLGKRPRPGPTDSDLIEEKDDSEISRAQKRVRLGSVPSFTSSVATASEEPDSPSRVPTRTQYCQVILDHKSDFDPTEYHSVRLTQSTNQHSSQSVSVLESQDQNIVLAAGHSQNTIPDSQEVSSLETQATRSSGIQLIAEGISQASAFVSRSQTAGVSCQHPAASPASLSATIQGSLIDVIPQTVETAAPVTSQRELEAYSRSFVKQETEEESIPSHQPESRGRTWAFTTQFREQGSDHYSSQSRVAMSTPRESQDLHGPESSRQADSASHATNAYLTQPAQVAIQGETPGPEPGSYSAWMAKTHEERQALAESISEDDSDDDEEDSEDSEDAARNGQNSSTGQDPPAVTCSLADVDVQPAQPTSEIPVLPSIDLSGNSIPMVSVIESQFLDVGSRESQPPCIITLPLRANLEKDYVDELNLEQELILRYDASDQADEVVDEEASAAVDRLFDRLQSVCDYPEGDTKYILDLPVKERAARWIDCSPKASFISELLTGIGEEIALKVVIVVDLGYVLERLCELMERIGTVAYTCSALDRSLNRPMSRIHVTLGLTDDKVDAWDADVFIAYNRAFNGSVIERNLMDATRGQGRTRPLILKLVTSQSIEHADVEISKISERFHSSAERKHALLFAIMANEDAILEPSDFTKNPGSFPEARLAAELCKYLLNEADFAEIDIEPVDLCYPVERVLESTQVPDAQDELGGGRKRQRDEAEEDDESKRQRRYSRAYANAPVPPLSSNVHRLLREGGWNFATGIAEPQVSLPLSVLDSLSAQFFEHERIIENTTKEEAIQQQLLETMRTVTKDQKFYDRAVEDLKGAYGERGEAQKRAAVATAALTQMEQKLTLSEEKHSTRIRELEAHVSRLQSDTAAPLVEIEKELKEANDKITMLQKRLQTAQRNEEYIRSKYQEQSAAGNDASAEAAAATQKIAELERKADKTRVEIQEANNNYSTIAFRNRIAELETAAAYNKMELDRLRQENRDLKHNRRETRQGSTPRSPRPGLMSPRGRGAALSREGSPIMGGVVIPGGNGGIAGMQYTSQNGGGRWGRGQVP